MILLMHEVWEDLDNNSEEFARPTKHGDNLRSKVSPNAKLIHVIHASSRNEAMRLYYEWRGYAPYRQCVAGSSLSSFVAFGVRALSTGLRRASSKFHLPHAVRWEFPRARFWGTQPASIGVRRVIEKVSA